MSNLSTARSRSTGRVLTILAFVFAVVGFIVAPLIFGTLAIALGLVSALALGDRPLGYWAAAAGAAAIVLGLIVTAALR